MQKLVASASIDENNVSYKYVDGKLVEEIFNVITAQSKALLFNVVVETIEKMLGEGVAINSTPIVGTSIIFNDSVTTKTIPI
ncbi:hypothetical protein ACFSSE_14340 [Pedobacter alpinus]|uniref:Uncharacterized protein n=2 Tax=Pedobacter alpinus TaxID=1590643 RepID=A0ABW5TUU8_9SPHI